MKYLSKEKITETVLKVVKPEYSSADLQRAIITWWSNIRKDGGYSLTAYGDAMFLKAELEYWTFPLSFLHVSKTMLDLDKKIQCPYYFYFSKTHQSVKIYDSKIAVMIALHGDLKSYLSKK